MALQNLWISSIVTLGSGLGMFSAVAQERDVAMVQVAVPKFGSSWLKVPNADVIEKITCRLNSHPFGIDETEDFEIPKERFADILRHFDEDIEVDPHPAIATELGSMAITTTDGFTQRILIFWTLGKQPVNFSLRGVRLRGLRKQWLEKNSPGVTKDGSFEVYDILRRIYKEQEKDGQRKVP